MDHMRSAIALARRGLGTTWPNPSVGCVIVQNDRVVGRGVTAPGGRPHAEAVALAMAGTLARGATAYVTLEPCSHYGRTPPCTDALIAAGITRVVVGAQDPDPRVDGRGLAKLQAAGIEVQQGVLGDEVDDLLSGFRHRILVGRPLVTLKLASTLDGRIAAHTSESRWITGSAARRAAHVLRGRHDAILVGVGTVLADDPDLNCRLSGFRTTPIVRVVADSHLRTPMTARLIASAREVPTWLMMRAGPDPDRRRALAALGVHLVELPGASTGIDLRAGLQALGAAGITRLMVEGGARVAAALLRDGLVDRLAWFHAPGVLGDDSWPAVRAMGIDHLVDMPRFVRKSVATVGSDLFSEFVRAE